MIKEDGLDFKSEHHFADYANKKYNINKGTIYSRLRKGIDPKEAIIYEKYKHAKISKANEIIVGGEKYTSIRAYCKLNDIAYETIRYIRKKYNCTTIDECIVVLNNKKTIMTIKGKEFNSLQEISDYFNIDIGILMENIYRKTEVNEVLSSVLDNGIYDELRLISMQYKMKLNLLRDRMKNGCTIMEAVDTNKIKESPKGLSLMYEDKEYTSLGDIETASNISLYLIKSMSNIHKITLQESLNLVNEYFKDKRKRNKFIDHKPYCIINGIIYNSLREFSEEYNISKSRIRYAMGRTRSNLKESLIYLTRYNERLKDVDLDNVIYITRDLGNYIEENKNKKEK